MTNLIDKPLFADEDELDAPMFGAEKSTGIVQKNIANTIEKKWKLVVVDDEQAIHDVTIMALKRFEFQHKKIEFHHA